MTGSSSSCAEAVLAVFAAIEHRDAQALAGACQTDVEFFWPPTLPYGGTTRGLGQRSQGWVVYWDRLQPTAALRRLDPRVVAATGQDVVVSWRQRGLTWAGESIDTEVVGLYQVLQGKLARAQMFYFDPAAVSAFLARAAQAPPAQDAPAENPPRAGRST
jgi:ketosteroid isomerase-like protein